MRHALGQLSVFPIRGVFKRHVCDRIKTITLPCGIIHAIFYHDIENLIVSFTIPAMLLPVCNGLVRGALRTGSFHDLNIIISPTRVERQTNTNLSRWIIGNYVSFWRGRKKSFRSVFERNVSVSVGKCLRGLHKARCRSIIRNHGHFPQLPREPVSVNNSRR